MRALFSRFRNSCRRSSLLIVVIITAGWLINSGCQDVPAEDVTSEEVSETAPTALLSVTSAIPTPTLAPGLPTAPPAPPTLAPGVTPDTPTPTETPTPTMTPTPTPMPAERIELGQAKVQHGDYVAAARQFEAGLDGRQGLSPEQQEVALYELGTAYLQEGNFTAAAATFNELLAQAAGRARSEVYFFLGQANSALGDYPGAIGAYQSYIKANPEMAAYISPYVAEAYLALEDRDSAVAAYERALSGLARRQRLIDIRNRLAEYYAAEANYEAAALQYEAILELADTDRLRGQANYLAGYHWILAGESAAGYQRYLTGIANYPRAYESYLGLVSLVEAGYPVDEFQRGIVDYHAEMFDPAIEALQRYITAFPEDYQPIAHLYLAWSLEAQGDQESALAELAKYAQAEPDKAMIEQAKLYARLGDATTAIERYLDYLASFPEGDQAPFAAWWAAALTENAGDLETAIQYYSRLGETYPWHEDAAEALFRAGWLSYLQEDMEAAWNSWRQAATAHPDSHYGGASLYWLLKTNPDVTLPSGSTPSPTPGPDDEADPGAPATPSAVASPSLQTAIEQLVANQRSENYYALRAKDLFNGVPPFARADQSHFSLEAAIGQDEAESWLRSWLGLATDQDVASMAAELSNDARLIVGEKLWRLGLWEEAKWELESLRLEYKEDGLASYQLALYFRDLGLYRSSILAASSLLSLSGETIFEAPKFIGRLIYPTYFADLIVPLAGSYGYDPVLQFALVRQESLFESFARSGAAAQGLAQVIPDTGAYIAERLSWPDYENEDLYKPYVGLAFGAYYLDQQLRIFDGHVHVALSAYNAGPGNAARWYEQAGSDHDQYLEAIDFAETHLYVERIYVGHVIYRFLYQ